MAVADLFPEKLEARGRSFGIADTYARLQEAAGPRRHRRGGRVRAQQQARAADHRGPREPASTSTARSRWPARTATPRRMYGCRRKAGRKLHIQMATIYKPETRAAKRLIDERRTSAASTTPAPSATAGAAGRSSTATARPTSSTKRSAAGGALFDMGIYHLAQVLHLIGNPDGQDGHGRHAPGAGHVRGPARFQQLQRRGDGPGLGAPRGRHLLRHRGDLGGAPRRPGGEQDPRQQGRPAASTR